MPEKFANHISANRPNADQIGVSPHQPDSPHGAAIATSNKSAQDEESIILGSLHSSSRDGSNGGSGYRAPIVASVVLTLYLGLPGRRLRDRIRAILCLRNTSLDSSVTMYNNNLAQSIQPCKSSPMQSCPC